MDLFIIYPYDIHNLYDLSGKSKAADRGKHYRYKIVCSKNKHVCE